MKTRTTIAVAPAKFSDEIRRHVRDGGVLETEADLLRLANLHQARSASKTISFKRKPFAPYLAKMADGDDLETLFLEFLKGRYGA